METVIDTVEACTLELGDVTYWGTVETVIDYGDTVVLYFENDEDEAVVLNALEPVCLLGMVYSESI